MRIAVAGGTGLVGRLVVAAAQASGHEAVVLARATGVDLSDPAGVAEALAGVDAVVDATNVVTRSAEESVAFFSRVSRTLLAAEAQAAVRHHVVLSIVGIDRVALPYYAGKLEQERIVADGAVPWTVLRATQFHDFARQVLAQVPGGPVTLVPRMRSATVSASEVADELVRLVAGGPAGFAREIAGPQVHRMPDLVRRLYRAEGTKKLVVPVTLPGAGGKAMARGDLLPTGDPTRGAQTFDQWLAGR